MLQTCSIQMLIVQFLENNITHNSRLAKSIIKSNSRVDVGVFCPDLVLLREAATEFSSRILATKILKEHQEHKNHVDEMLSLALKTGARW